MEQPKLETPFSEQESGIGRRQLLKALATSSAVIVFTQLPRQWTAPRTNVNTLPIHAQTSGALASYSGVCDSLPGGGDLRITNGSINNIQPYLQLISGIATLQGIPATMNVEVTSGTLPNFSPALPQATTTNASGQAAFGNLMVTGNPGDHFFLVFDFTTPTGNVQLRCGEFYFGNPVPTQ
ncbi:MAG TPA: hypothetical protein VMP08_06375 [Anaerolineae bacterium]|nr:hypothetical protein [Anaerolineae bacterium]